MESTLHDIEDKIHQLREDCRLSLRSANNSREEAYLRAAVDVLEGLERTFHRSFEESEHIVSPKSREPWD